MIYTANPLYWDTFTRDWSDSSCHTNVSTTSVSTMDRAVFPYRGKDQSSNNNYHFLFVCFADSLLSYSYLRICSQQYLQIPVYAADKRDTYLDWAGIHFSSRLSAFLAFLTNSLFIFWSVRRFLTMKTSQREVLSIKRSTLTLTRFSVEGGKPQWGRKSNTGITEQCPGTYVLLHRNSRPFTTENRSPSFSSPHKNISFQKFPVNTTCDLKSDSKRSHDKVCSYHHTDIICCWSTSNTYIRPNN